jgi:NDP-sugar pyrophosphorylase family protein
MSSLSSFIACGGRGSRLQELTDELPKPLLEVAGKPMLFHIIEELRRQEIGNIVLGCGYKGDVIRARVGEIWPDVRVSQSSVDDGILRRLSLASALLDDEIYVVYGDTFVALDVENFLAFHRSHAGACSILTTQIQNPFGVVTQVGDRVQRFVEKPLQTHFIGAFLLDRSALRGLPEAMIDLPDGQGIVAMFNHFISGDQLFAYSNRDLTLTFNTKEELVDVNEKMRTYLTL